MSGHSKFANIKHKKEKNELPIEGVSSQLIYDNLRPDIDKILCKKEEVIDILKEKEIEVLMTLGAGDIENYAPQICEILDERC